MDAIRPDPMNDAWLESPGPGLLLLGIGSVLAIWALVVILAWL